MFPTLLAVAVVGSIVILKYATAPWIFVGATWCALLFFFAYRERRTSFIGPFFMNLGAAILAVTLFETYLERQASMLRYEGHQHPPSGPDETLGYAMLPNEHVVARAYYRDAEVFDVAYTTDELGLRSTPGSDSAGVSPSRRCLFFFGGSFMFGAGVNDPETTPSLVGEATHGLFRIYNFGVGGYGPHQMLAALESGYVRDVTECDDVAHAFYLGIPAHPRRAAGRMAWDPHGPRYVIDDDGLAEYTGHFDDGGPFAQRLLNQLRKSKTYTRAREAVATAIGSDIDLFVAIVRTAKRRFERDHADGQFHVLFWDNAPSNVFIVRALQAAGIEAHLASEILPAFETSAYSFAGDRHPTPLAHESLAEFIVELIR